jgi:uncharacterized membrane protein
MYSKVKIFGHPVHPMLVSFPVAFYTATLAGFIVFAARGGAIWMRITIAMNVAGVGMALIAAIPGFIDWASGIPRGSRAKMIGLRHLALNVIALVAFAVSMGLYASRWNGPFTFSAGPGILLAAVGVASTILAGFHGWMLVQDHHVGVNPDRILSEGHRESDLRAAG